MSALAASRVPPDRRAKGLKAEIRLDFACNDPDNGLFAGRVCQIELPEQALTLEAKRWNGLSLAGCPLLREHGSLIILSGKQWSITRSKDWYGNWCWNAYWMEKYVALGFLAWLRGRDLFHATSGDSLFFDAWNDPEPAVLCEIIKLNSEAFLGPMAES